MPLFLTSLEVLRPAPGRPAWSGALGPQVGHVCPEGMRCDLVFEGGCPVLWGTLPCPHLALGSWLVEEAESSGPCPGGWLVLLLPRGLREQGPWLGLGCSRPHQVLIQFPGEGAPPS